MLSGGEDSALCCDLEEFGWNMKKKKGAGITFVIPALQIQTSKLISVTLTLAWSKYRVFQDYTARPCLKKKKKWQEGAEQVTHTHRSSSSSVHRELLSPNQRKRFSWTLKIIILIHSEGVKTGVSLWSFLVVKAKSLNQFVPWKLGTYM